MTLAELISSEPMNDTATDQQVLDWLHESVSVHTPINSRRLLRWAGGEGRLAKLEDAAASHVSAEVRAVARVGVLTVSRPDTELDVDDPKHEQMIDGLVAGGVLSVDDKAELVAMATTTAPRWRAAGQAPMDAASRLHWIKEARNAA